MFLHLRVRCSSTVLVLPNFLPPSLHSAHYIACSNAEGIGETVAHIWCCTIRIIVVAIHKRGYNEILARQECVEHHAFDESTRQCECELYVHDVCSSFNVGLQSQRIKVNFKV